MLEVEPIGHHGLNNNEAIITSEVYTRSVAPLTESVTSWGQKCQHCTDT